MKEVYASEAAIGKLPENVIPHDGISAGAAKQLVLDELLLDNNPTQNLATFVTTYMEPEAEELIARGTRTNMIDADEYPQTSTIHQRCVNIIGSLWNAQPDAEGNYTGTSCVGSSEAIMLATLAMKFRWRKARKSAGLSTDKPNMVFGSNVQCCWHKACLYFDIECREADVSEDILYLTADRAKPLIDENTIGVCPILGSTFTGTFENVKEIHDMVKSVNDKNGWNVPIHVDAASGGFIAPFLRPELNWDFRLPLVKSINASGHKFGLVYAGIGWLLFNEKDSLPDELVTHVNYLGGDQASFTLNFSKPASCVLGQYYQFLRLGRKGYTDILKNGMLNAQFLRDMLLRTQAFDIVDDGDMPLVAFKMKDPVKSGCTLFDVQDALKARGWTLPAYRCSKGAENLVIMRAVIKQNCSRTLLELLRKDIEHALAFFKEHPNHLQSEHNKQYMEQEKKKRKLGDMCAEDTENPHLASRHITAKLVNGNKGHILSGKKTHGVC